MPPMISGLIAYPSDPEEIGQTISHSLDKLNKHDRFDKFHSWEETDIPGRFISTEVLKLIDSGTAFIADITRLNFNVVFEIGYAIGRKKRAILLRNDRIRPEADLVRSVGIFDTLGYKSYTDSTSLVPNQASL
jgi:nucleoside 2-deoxyribosyltransferase